MDALDDPLEVARQVGAVGLVAAAALVAMARARPGPPRRSRPPMAAAGVVLAVAATVAVRLVADGEGLGVRQATGLAAAAAGASLAARLHLPAWAASVLVIPGAVLTVDAMPLTDHPEVVGPAIVSAAVLAVLVGEADHAHAASAVGPPLLAVSIAGMYGTIPETGLILPILVVAVPIGLVGWPARSARLGTAGAAASVVLLVAVVAEGGQDRLASIVGGLACFGVLALDPVARAVVPGPTTPPDHRALAQPALLLTIHVVVVAVASRVAGLRSDVLEATAIVAAMAGVALCALVVLVRGTTPRAASD
ncbi:MAG TPA: hypothetical protein VFZ79_14000 [Acidimicrobiales bacterium]